MKEFIYEILVRGSQSGFDAAHMIRGKVVVDEEGEERLKLGKAEPLDVSAVQNVLGEQSTKLLCQVQELQAEVERLTSSLSVTTSK